MNIDYSVKEKLIDFFLENSKFYVSDVLYIPEPFNSSVLYMSYDKECDILYIDVNINKKGKYNGSCFNKAEEYDNSHLLDEISFENSFDSYFSMKNISNNVLVHYNEIDLDSNSSSFDYYGNYSDYYKYSFSVLYIKQHLLDNCNVELDNLASTIHDKELLAFVENLVLNTVKNNNNNSHSMRKI